MEYRLLRKCIVNKICGVFVHFDSGGLSAAETAGPACVHIVHRAWFCLLFFSRMT